ncbi:hypothetical protein HVZ60_17565 [Escherichia coli]|nr:hypothetical protein [Escherichia coli]
MDEPTILPRHPAPYSHWSMRCRPNTPLAMILIVMELAPFPLGKRRQLFQTLRLNTRYAVATLPGPRGQFVALS